MKSYYNIHVNYHILVFSRFPSFSGQFTVDNFSKCFKYTENKKIKAISVNHRRKKDFNIFQYDIKQLLQKAYNL